MAASGVFSRMFGSLRIRNYRLFWAGQAVSQSGTWMQQLAQDWLVLELGGGGAEVGLAVALQFLPLMTVGMWGGLMADRFDKRRILMVTQTAYAALAVTLGLLTVTGAVRMWQVFVLAFLFGLVTAVDQPTRQAFVTELVGAEGVANAVALNAASINAARMVGPAIGAVLIQSVGIATAFFVNAASFVAVLTGLVLMRPHELLRMAKAPRLPGQIRAGLRYIASEHGLRWPITLVAILGIFGLQSAVYLPLFAKFTFAGSAGLYGVFTVVHAFGAIVGALLAASRSRPSTRWMIAAAGLLGVCGLLASVVPAEVLFVILLAPMGMMSILAVANANASLQLRSKPEMRGRVMAVYGLVFLGTTPIGGPLTGWLAEVTSPRGALAITSVVLAFGATVCWFAEARQGLAVTSTEEIAPSNRSAGV